MEDSKFVITKGLLDELVTSESVKESSTFDSIEELEKTVIDRTIKKSIKKIESSDYISRKLVGLEVSEDQLENLGIAIEELTVSSLLISTDEKMAKGYKSEKLSDYSYTIGEGSAGGHVDIEYLIEDLKKEHGAKKSVARISLI